MFNLNLVLDAYSKHDYASLTGYLRIDLNLSLPAELLSLPILRNHASYRASLLFLASYDNDVEMVQFLLDAGVDVHRGITEQRPHNDIELACKLRHMSPLCAATVKGAKEATTLLLNMGADLLAPIVTFETLGRTDELVSASVLDYLALGDKRSLICIALKHLFEHNLDFDRHEILDYLIENDDLEGVQLMYAYRMSYNKSSNHNHSRRPAANIRPIQPPFVTATNCASVEMMSCILNLDDAISRKDLIAAIEMAIAGKASTKLKLMVEHEIYKRESIPTNLVIAKCLHSKHMDILPFLVAHLVKSTSISKKDYDSFCNAILSLLTDERHSSVTNNSERTSALVYALLELVSIRRPISSKLQQYVINMAQTSADAGDLSLLARIVEVSQHLKSIFARIPIPLSIAYREHPDLTPGQHRRQIDETLNLLLELGFSLEKKNKNNLNALEQAIEKQHLYLATALIERNAKLERSFDAFSHQVQQLPKLLPVLFKASQSPYNYTDLLRLMLGPSTWHVTCVCLIEFLKPQSIPLAHPERYMGLGEILSDAEFKADNNIEIIINAQLLAAMYPEYSTVIKAKNIVFTLDIERFKQSILRYLENDRISPGYLARMFIEQACNVNELMIELARAAHVDKFHALFDRFNSLNDIFARLVSDGVCYKLNDEFHAALHRVADLLGRSESMLHQLDQTAELSDRIRKKNEEDKIKNKKIRAELENFYQAHTGRMTAIHDYLSILMKRFKNIQLLFTWERLTNVNYAAGLIKQLEQPLTALQMRLDLMPKTLKQVDHWRKVLHTQSERLHNLIEHANKVPLPACQDECAEAIDAAKLLDSLEARLTAISSEHKQLSEKRRRQPQAQSTEVQAQLTTRLLNKPKLIMPVQSYTSLRQYKPATLHDALQLSKNLHLKQELSLHQAVLACPFPIDAFHQRLEQNSLLGSCARLFEQLKHYKSPYLLSNEARLARNAIYHADWSATLSPGQKHQLHQLGQRLSKLLSNQGHSTSMRNFELNSDSLAAELPTLDESAWARQMAASWQDWVDMTSLIAAVEVPEAVVALAKGFVIARLSICAKTCRREFPEIWGQYAEHHTQLMMLIETGNRLRHGGSQ